MLTTGAVLPCFCPGPSVVSGFDTGTTMEPFCFTLSGGTFGSD